MTRNRISGVVVSASLFMAGMAAGIALRPANALHAQAGARVFELRTYTAPPGKLADLEARFRDHTIDVFNRHGMTSIGYWVQLDAPLSQNTLIYILAHPSREAAAANWAAFRADPEWQKVSAASQVNGTLVDKVDSVFVNATDFSPIK